MVTLDGIRRVYYLSNFLWIFKEYGQLSPIFIPGFQDVRVFLISLLAELFLCKFGVIKVHSAVNFLQISADCLTVFVRHELAAVANLMDYTELIFRLGETKFIALQSPVDNQRLWRV